MSAFGGKADISRDGWRLIVANRLLNYGTLARPLMGMQREAMMKTRYTVTLSLLAGVALGVAAMQGLHAQAKLKAYSVGEIEVTNASAQPGYLPTVRKAIENSHGRTLRTLNGRVVSIEGGAPPKNVAIVEWDSLDDAVAFYKSKAWTDMAPQRDKSQKAIRRYVVEVEK
jgi:uncharacterized protein (DUF1330 family)